MNKHPYYHLLAVLRKQRNSMIEDFRHFKRHPVNRKWMSHNAFSTTINKFRKNLAQIDKVITGAKLAIKVSRETGIIHWFNYCNNSIEPVKFTA